MKSFASISIALLLAGCGGTQAVPQNVSSAPLPQVKRAKPWMLPEAKNEDLVYATGEGQTLVFAYPSGHLLSTISLGGAANCSDAQGNVFVTNTTSVYEFTHGATTPTATLYLPGQLAEGCAVDSLTNNLAVVFKGGGGDIAIFSNEQGKPSVYNSHIDSLFCGFDNSGNLFVNGFFGQNYAFAELPNGASVFTDLSISDTVGSPGQVQWDGKYITYEGISPEATAISRLSISGSSATVVSFTGLFGIKRRAYESWIFKGKVVAPYATHGFAAKRIAIWPYPKGGWREKTFPHFSTKQTAIMGVTVSVPPSNTRTR